MAIQLNHLKTAMSVLVKEKTEMQHQLREAHETGEMRERQIQSIQSELADRNGRLMRAEAEMGAARHEIEKLN
ncbi:unnamed protein product, partial [Anisakis simplex]|uniref:Phage shock protein A n=1 Tax=Anisakis simplex TaxID=6269 RepID=A0A0M3JQG7_ANISI